ncbi:L-lactate oxidase-like [Amblyomma americanum]
MQLLDPTDSSKSARLLREYRRLSSRATEAIWQQQLKILRLQVTARAQVKGTLHNPEGLALPEDIKNVLALGPKFAYETKKSGHELLSMCVGPPQQQSIITFRLPPRCLSHSSCPRHKDVLAYHGIQGQTLVEEDGTALVTIADIQRLGEANLNGPTRSYVANGVEQQRTLRENREAFTRLRFRPRALVDVSKIYTATTLLGRRVSFPVGFAPSAAHMMADPIGEFGTAQAARDAGTVMILSAMSTASLEDLRARVPDCLLWQQTYIFRNRSLTESLVRRAAAHDFGAIVVTVDSPVTGQDIGLQNNMFRLAPGLRFANLEASSPARSFTFDPTSADSVDGVLSPAATGEDIRWLWRISGLPIVVKGVLTAEAALKAFEFGAAAVLVSNHGGRQLDGDPATIEALPEIVAAVGGRMEVYLDSGVRSGADAVKALSLGARAIFVGRPAIWGLAYNVRLTHCRF